MIGFARRILRGPAGGGPAGGAPAGPVSGLGSTADARPATTVVELSGDESVEVSVGEPDPGLRMGHAADGAGRPTGGPANRWDQLPPRAQILRLGALVAVIVVTVALGAAVLTSAGAPTIDELRQESGWASSPSLTVGVNGDVPGISLRAPDGEYTGFDVDIAYLVAQRLGFQRHQVHFVEVTPEDRHRMVGYAPGSNKPVDLDLVVAAYSITAQRVQQDKVVFAGPYLRTETSVLTRRDAPAIESLAALTTGGPGGGPQRVCTPGTSTSREYLQHEAPGTSVILVQRNSECVQQLLDRRVDAAVIDAAILAGYAVRYGGQLRLHNITSTTDEYWGIGLGVDLTGTDRRLQARRNLVLLALADLHDSTVQDGWDRAFETDLRPLEKRLSQPAAGEQQQIVADDRQPAPLATVTIRRWPWDAAGGGS